MDETNKALNQISATWDRFQEAHFWLHNMEETYHFADPFRWSFNAYLRALKEISQLLTMESNKIESLKSWWKNKKNTVYTNPLLKVLSDKRDFIVHRDMLLLESKGWIGLTELRGLKIGLNIAIHPLEDSDSAMERYLSAGNDVFGLLQDDDDSMPCVMREWKIKEFDENLVEIAAQAWLLIADILGEALTNLGANVPKLSLDCRHSDQSLKFKLYERETLREKTKDNNW